MKNTKNTVSQSFTITTNQTKRTFNGTEFIDYNYTTELEDLTIKATPSQIRAIYRELRNLCICARPGIVWEVELRVFENFISIFSIRAEYNAVDVVMGNVSRHFQIGKRGAILNK